MFNQERMIGHTDPLYYGDLRCMDRLSIGLMRSNIKKSLRNLEEGIEEARYDDSLLSKIEQEIDMRQQNIEFIDDYVQQMNDRYGKNW